MDDILIAVKSKLEIGKLKLQLNEEFKIKDLGEAKKILGMEIQRDRLKGTVGLSQKAYLQKVLRRFGMDGNIKAVSTPLAPHFKLSAALSSSTDEEKEYMSRVPYPECSWEFDVRYGLHPTRSFSSHQYSQSLHACTEKQHWQAVRWILRYIYGIMDMGL